MPIPSLVGGKQQGKHAHRLARAQQDDLRHRAFRLGATIYVETQRAFARRMSAYWVLAVEEGPELATGGIAKLARDEQQAAVAAKARDATRTVERERKFLVSQTPQLPDRGVALRQDYVAIDGTVSVRVRDSNT